MHGGVADSFLLNYKARLLKVINRKDLKNFPVVYNVCNSKR